ncbi:MAG: zf-HC2 domain-containing protein [bacterium]
MDHSYYRDRISAYADGELSPMEKEAVRRHLDECEQCRQLLGEIERLDQLVADKASLPDGDYWEQSAQAIEQRLDTLAETKITDVSRFRWTGMTGKIVAVAASVAVLAFIGLYQSDILKDVQQTPRILETPATKDDETVEKQASEPKMSRRGDVESKADDETVAIEIPPAPKIEVDFNEAELIEAVEVAPQTNLMAVDTQLTPEAKTVQELLQDVSGVAKGRSGQVYSEATSTKIDSVSPEPGDVGSKKTEPHAVEEVSVTASAKSQVAMKPVSVVPMRITEKAVETDAAAETVVSWVVIPPTDTSLAGWRQRRDSLQTLHADLTSPHRELADAKARRIRPEVSIDDVERQLLRSYYEIARLTPDVQERAVAIDYLTRHTENPNACCKDAAVEYLRELGVGRE